MEPVFECIHTSNVEMNAEKSRKVLNTGRTPMAWVYMVLAAAMIGMLIWQPALRWGLLAAILFCAGLYNFCGHRILAEQDIRRIKRENGCMIPSSTVTVTDCFNLHFGSSTMSFAFSSLETAYFLQHSILIINNEKAYMTFQRTGFTKGTPEELEVFIREKCPQAQIIHKE